MAKECILLVWGAAQTLKERGSLPFVLLFGAMSFLVSDLIDRSLFGGYDLPEMSLQQILFAAVVVAPIAETFLLQYLPVVLVRRRHGTEAWQFVAASIPFAILHFPQGLQSGLSAGVVGGIFLALSFVVWARRSDRSAYWVTAGVHAVSNGITFLTIVFARQVG